MNKKKTKKSRFVEEGVRIELPESAASLALSKVAGSIKAPVKLYDELERMKGSLVIDQIEPMTKLATGITSEVGQLSKLIGDSDVTSNISGLGKAVSIAKDLVDNSAIAQISELTSHVGSIFAGQNDVLLELVKPSSLLADASKSALSFLEDYQLTVPPVVTQLDYMPAPIPYSEPYISAEEHDRLQNRVEELESTVAELREGNDKVSQETAFDGYSASPECEQYEFSPNLVFEYEGLEKGGRLLLGCVTRAVYKREEKLSVRQTAVLLISLTTKKDLTSKEVGKRIRCKPKSVSNAFGEINKVLERNGMPELTRSTKDSSGRYVRIFNRVDYYLRFLGGSSN